MNNSLTMANKGVEKNRNDETNSDNPLRTMTRFYVRIPLCFVHLNHPVGESATMGQYVRKRILDKIYELASHNVTNVAEVGRILWSVGRRNIRNLSKKVAQGYNEKGDGVGFPVLSYKTNIYPLRCNLS